MKPEQPLTDGNATIVMRCPICNEDSPPLEPTIPARDAWRTAHHQRSPACAPAPTPRPTATGDDMTIEVHIENVYVTVAEPDPRLDDLVAEIKSLRSFITRKLGSMADRLEDFEAQLLDSNIDIVGAVNALVDTDTRADTAEARAAAAEAANVAAEARIAELEQALIDAGVDPEARATILAGFRDQQARVRAALDALNPEVPVPEEPPVPPVE